MSVLRGSTVYNSRSYDKKYQRIWPSTTENKNTSSVCAQTGFTTNVKRARGEMFIHDWGKVKCAFFVRAQFKIIEFVFEFSVSILLRYDLWEVIPDFSCIAF